MSHSYHSLDDVHESIDPQKKKSKWGKILSFFGPAYLISVGYMDPGNWATDLAGGSQFGYKLLWVLVVSNLIALFLQSLCARLGIVRGKDLAQCNRELYPKGLNFVLYLFAEIAIAACDLAEILGMAIGLQLLFGIDLLWGVLISFADTLLLMLLQRYGMRKMELFIIGLIFIIGMCFLIEMFIAKPDLAEVASGFIPSIPNHTALYIAIGIIGATVMPHNLYLHSALVQTRKIKKDSLSIKKSIKYNFWDTAIALNLAFFVNAAILILAATVFHKNNMHGIAELEDAHKLLEPLLGSDLAPKLFAIALIAAGQSSTITGTLAGQIVMEGYLQLRINPIFRRMITRLVAIVPALIVIIITHDKGVGQLLIFSQVLLSMQLGFAIIPLIHFVSDKQKMGEFVIGKKSIFTAWLIAGLIVILNLKLVFDEALIWLNIGSSIWKFLAFATAGVAIAVLLFLTIFYPYIKKSKANLQFHNPIQSLELKQSSQFNRIALAVDFSQTDQIVLQYGLQLAHQDSVFILIHITESASPQLLGKDAEDYEIRHDREIMIKYVNLIQEKGYNAEYALGYKDRNKEIARICDKKQADLLIMGSHGHKVFKDILFGETVNNVRHLVKIPVFIAQ
ncbi:MAG: Nramp family divalent metal transporter [Chitinophagales bacterium]|nr:Nramp family divalent metal transporter [Chitinophagales bacterium]MCZ2392365.1 Nramp family divalent metal transporter [Chitinophagales bacterium]